MPALALALWLVTRSAVGAQEASRASIDGPAQVAGAFGQAHTPAELRRRLATFDAPLIPVLFRAAALGVIRVPESGEFVLAGADRGVLRESLAQRPRRELIAFLEQLGAAPIERELRLEAQLLLGSMGTADHLRLLARVSVAPQDRGPVEVELREGFEHALSAILARDPSTLGQITGFLAEGPPGLAASIVDAVAGTRSVEGTRVLAGLLGRAPGLDPLLLTRIAQGGRLHSRNDASVFDAVRRYLRHRDARIVCAAMQACAAIGDDEAVEPLMGLIEHASEQVKAGAFRALEEITGLHYGPDPVYWTSWYHHEMRWWDEDAEASLLSVERGSALEFSRAAREVLEHRLYRDRMAESFATALERRDSGEVRLACRALEQLRSPVATGALVERLDDVDARVRTAAWQALRAITGAELPPESDSWSSLAGR